MSVGGGCGEDGILLCRRHISSFASPSRRHTPSLASRGFMMENHIENIELAFHHFSSCVRGEERGELSII